MKRLVCSAALVGIAASSFAIFGINTGPNDSSNFAGVYSFGVGIGGAYALTAKHAALHVGDTAMIGGTQYTVTNRFDDNPADLSMLQFDKALPGSFSLYNTLLTGDPGIETTIVGYGQSGIVRADHTGFDIVAGSGGTQRAATNTIGDVETITATPDYNFTYEALFCDLDSPFTDTPTGFNRDWFGDGSATANEGGVWAGDSGGAWLVNTPSGFQLAGITTVNLADDTAAFYTGDPSLEGLFFGVSGAGAVNLTNADVHQWIVSTVPEPASFAPLALGALLLIRRRKR